MYKVSAGVFAIAGLLVGCGSSSSSSTTPSTNTDTGVETTPAREPKKHRPSVTSCPTDRPAGSASRPEGGDCTTDADCTKGKNGRCYGGLRPNLCTYDECAVDADCGNAVCECRVNARLGQPNVCFRGNCRTDADCKGNYCSPSAVDVGLECVGVKVGSYGYFCHGTADECIDDADCTGKVSNCVFDVDALHWKCVSVACPG